MNTIPQISKKIDADKDAEVYISQYKGKYYFNVRSFYTKQGERRFGKGFAIDVSDGHDNAIAVVDAAIKCINEAFGTNFVLAEMEE